MDKYSVMNFLEIQIKANKEEYERLNNFATASGMARQFAFEKRQELKKKLYHLELIIFLLSHSETKNKYTEALLAEPRKEIPAALEFVQSEIMDIQDELIDLEGMIREESWETEEEKQRMLDDRQAKKEELEYWKYLKEFLNNF